MRVSVQALATRRCCASTGGGGANLLMLAATDGLDRLFNTAFAPLRLARRLGIAAVDRAPPLKRLFIWQAIGVTAGG